MLEYTIENIYITSTNKIVHDSMNLNLDEEEDTLSDDDDDDDDDDCPKM